MTQKDEKFKAPLPRVNDFDFVPETARVFDDMLDRSVPFYSEIQRMMGEIAKDFAIPNSKIYDLGCSTGTTLHHLSPVSRSNCVHEHAHWSIDSRSGGEPSHRGKPL